MDCCWLPDLSLSSVRLSLLIHLPLSVCAFSLYSALFKKQVEQKESSSLFYSQPLLFHSINATTGDLPLQVLRLLTSMRRNGDFIDLAKAGPGLTLPVNIGNLDSSITKLDLRECNLAGALCYPDIRWLLFLRCVLFKCILHDVFVILIVAS